MPRPFYGQLNLSQHHPDVGRIWRSRDDELEPSPAWGMSDDLIVDPEPIQEEIDWLERVLETVELTRAEHIVIHCRLGLDLTLEEAGQKMGVTRERIRQIEARALRKIRLQAKRQHDSEEASLEHRMGPCLYTVWDLAGRPWFSGTQIECLEYVAREARPRRILRNGKTPHFTRELT